MTRIFSDRAPSGDAAPVGRGATTRSHGIEVLEGRSSNAHACRSTFQHLESCLRQTHPASVDSRSAVFPSFSSREKGPQRTSREGINPSPTDSPNDTVRVGRTPLYVPSKKKRVAGPVSRRRSRRALGATSRDGGWPGRTPAFGSDTRRHGGGGRRPSPTPPSEPPTRVIREIRVQNCDAAMTQIQCDGSAKSPKIRVHPRPINAMDPCDPRDPCSNWDECDAVRRSNGRRKWRYCVASMVAARSSAVIPPPSRQSGLPAACTPKMCSTDVRMSSESMLRS